MTVKYIGDGIYLGLAADTKPTSGVVTNAIYVTTDKPALHYYNGSSWVTDIPALSSSNKFTATQAISVNTGYVLALTREVSTVGFDVGMEFKQLNSSSAEVRVAAFLGGFVSGGNTAGAIKGQIKFQTVDNSSTSTVLTADNVGDVTIGKNQRLKFSESTQTSAHTITFPDATTLLLGESSAVSVSPLIKRTGSYQPSSGTTKDTVGRLEGLLSQHTIAGAGTNSNTFDTTEGVLINLATTTGSGENAGLVSPTGGVGVGRRLFAGKAKIRSKVDTVAGNVARFYFGFTSATSLPISDSPLGTSDHGIIVGFNSTDTTYKIYHNDGATSVTVDDVTGTPAISTGFHTIEISWTASGNIVVTFDGTAQTISTDLPATTANLYFNAVAQNVTGAARTHTIKGVWVEADK